MPSFFWFKYTCAMSWLIIFLSTWTAITSIGALVSTEDIRSQICAETELSSYMGNCSAAFKGLSDCNMNCEMIHSTCMRNCFLLASTESEEFEFGSVGADIAFALAVRRAPGFGHVACRPHAAPAHAPRRCFAAAGEVRKLHALVRVLAF